MRCTPAELSRATGAHTRGDRAISLAEKNIKIFKLSTNETLTLKKQQPPDTFNDSKYFIS